jgi:hypothetical protein
MTNRKHEAFDARVYEAVPEKGRCGVAEIFATVREALPDTHIRSVDGSLQRLRRAGKVQHVKVAGSAGWERVDSMTPASPVPAVVIAATSADAETLREWAETLARSNVPVAGPRLLALSRATVVDGAALRAWLSSEAAPASHWDFCVWWDAMPAELKALVGGDNG